MKKIIFIHPPWSYVYGNYRDAARAGNLYPPLGICYLASYIENMRPDYSVEVIDAEVEDLTIEDLIPYLMREKPILIGLTSTSPLFSQAKKLARLIKENLPTGIALGGSHATVLKNSILQEGADIDYLLYGEGEETIIELLDHLENRVDIKKIKGLVYRDGTGEVVDNGPRALIEDLDKYPYPNRELLNCQKYLWSVPGKGIVPFTTIMTTRGCPFQCIFCSARTVFGRTVRKRSIQDVINEMELIVEKLNIRHFSFIDDSFTLFKDRIIELCQEVCNRKLQITFEGFTRANSVDDDIMYMLKKAGMVRISFGIESGNPEMLKRIKKGIELEDVRRAFKLAKKYGLETKGSAIIGFPYETKETLMDTINFVASIRECDQVYLNVCTPYPGTELYDMAVKGEGGMKLLSKDFSKYMRYGNPVIEVGDLSKEDLVKYQKYGFRKFYFQPSRAWYNLKRAGLKAGIRNAFAFAKGIWGR